MDHLPLILISIPIIALIIWSHKHDIRPTRHQPPTSALTEPYKRAPRQLQAQDKRLQQGKNGRVA